MKYVHWKKLAKNAVKNSVIEQVIIVVKNAQMIRILKNWKRPNVS